MWLPNCYFPFVIFLALVFIPKFCSTVDEAKANQKSQAEHSQTESVSEQPQPQRYPAILMELTASIIVTSCRNSILTSLASFITTKWDLRVHRNKLTPLMN